jgi:hypothetical protein
MGELFYFIFYSGLNGPVKPNSNVGGTRLVANNKINSSKTFSYTK